MTGLFVGTSGYVYPHWRNGVFYPKNLPQGQELEYYSQHFNTVELNNPFYHLPEAKTFFNWAKRVPKNFIFAVKVSRFITHIKRLNQCQKPWKVFLERAENLGRKLGPFLFQFPPNWKKDLTRLNEFLELLEKTDLQKKSKISNREHRYVFEFRHPSWFSEDVYQVLRKYKNTSLCLADSPNRPFIEILTGDFVYIRMHGSKVLFSSKYTKKELTSLAQIIKKYLFAETSPRLGSQSNYFGPRRSIIFAMERRGSAKTRLKPCPKRSRMKRLSVYVYFNNDAYGYAIENAKALYTMVLKEFIKNTVVAI